MEWPGSLLVGFLNGVEMCHVLCLETFFTTYYWDTCLDLCGVPLPPFFQPPCKRYVLWFTLACL